MGSEATVFVTVGTDHHRFDRLIDWVDEYARGHEGARIVVQHGYSRAPTGPGIEAHAIIPFDELQQLLRTADVLVTPGPTTMMEALELGIRAICVPRDPALDEHVDDHQMTFARYFAGQGKCHLVSTRDDLFEAVDAGLADRSKFRFDASAAPDLPAIGRIAEIVDGLVWGSARGDS